MDVVYASPMNAHQSSVEWDLVLMLVLTALAIAAVVTALL
jgi:hypothetical protein